MAELLSIATALPEHRVGAAESTRLLAELLPASAAARFARALDASGNQTRYSVLPLGELRRLHTLEARNAAYRQHAVDLGAAVARDALRRAGIEPRAITAVVGISSTGYLMPTLETHLIERLGLSKACRRIPLTQLGCAGGVAGLGLAAALCSAGEARVLLVSVELPSLSFPGAEPSPIDIMASLQFGDGAAAAVLGGAPATAGPSLMAAAGELFPDSLERDGVHLGSDGLRLIRPRGLGDILRGQLGGAVDRFLASQALGRSDIAFWALHPRNPELLDAAAAGLALSDTAVRPSRTVWQRSGNLISAAVFHVLDELHRAAPPQSGSLGVAVAFGAGFGCEMALLRAGGWLSAH